MSRLVSLHGDAHFRRISRMRFVAAGFFFLLLRGGRVFVGSTLCGIVPVCAFVSVREKLVSQVIFGSS